MSHNKLKKFQILFFEDDTRMNKSITNYLIAEGYEVQSFINFEEAIQALNDGFCPDLALLDIQQNQTVELAEEPKAGFKVAEQLKSLTPHPPILFFTGHDDLEEEAKQFAPVDFVDKGGAEIDKFKKVILPKIHKIADTFRKLLKLEDYFKKAQKGKIGLLRDKSTKEVKVIELNKILYVQSENSNERKTYDKGYSRHDEVILKIIYKAISKEIKNDKRYLKPQILIAKGEDYFVQTCYINSFLPSDIRTQLKIASDEELKGLIPSLITPKILDLMLEEALKGTTTSYHQIESFKADNIIRNDSNHLVIEINQNKNLTQFHRNENKQCLRIYMKDGTNEEESNVSGLAFAKQMETYSEVHQINNPFLQVNDGVYANLDHVTKFVKTEDGRPRLYFQLDTNSKNFIYIYEAAYDSLRTYFPTLRTKV